MCADRADLIETSRGGRISGTLELADLRPQLLHGRIIKCTDVELLAIAAGRDREAIAAGLEGGAGRRVVVIAGPTAVGKSALALKLCEELHGELISVDSVQVYRGLAIGSNKPSDAEVAAVPHHLLNLRDPDEEYTAGAFYADALRAVEAIHSRGKLPVLVGGTSMYMRWLARGRPEERRRDALGRRPRQSCLAVRRGLWV